jgi:inorganic pyrophosphatase
VNVSFSDVTESVWRAARFLLCIQRGRQMKQIDQEKKKPTSGQLVHIIIDRPMNTYHPEHKDLFYPVNYGYIEGIIAPDGEEQDVYVLGIDHPVKEFTGKVIAIIHRLNDVEDKWVAVPENVTMTAEEIMEQIQFQEQYFETEIEMLK